MYIFIFIMNRIWRWPRSIETCCQNSIALNIHQIKKLRWRNQYICT